MSPSGSPLIVWLQRSLRLTDNPALAAAAARRQPILPVVIWPVEEPPAGGASRWWLHQSLTALSAILAERGGRIILRRGAPSTILAQLANETGATGLYFNRALEPASAATDARVRTRLSDRLEVHDCPGDSLFEPGTVVAATGEPYKVFTPFWRGCARMPEPASPQRAPARPLFFSKSVRSDSLDDWTLQPRAPDWAIGLRQSWSPGEAGALRALHRFLDDGLADYARTRDHPDMAGTSCLSPHLHFGELSPRQIWHAVRSRMAGDGRRSTGGEGFLRQLGWREFSLHLLHSRPDLPTEPFQRQFAHFPWRNDPVALRAWQRGLTGYPLVDAGMRQLWTTGWMHNRVRMVAASFLVKHLLIHWREGEAWFRDTLVDADCANNVAGWQWVAGCGADAAPYFRIFNPVLQGAKFDPAGSYVRRWVPELQRVPDKYIHAPWRASETILRAAGVRLGETYPVPIVEHDAARARALAAYARLRRQPSSPA